MNKLLTAAAAFIIVGGLILLTAPISRIPLLDANRQVLAESERGGYCAGDVYYQTRGAGSEAAMAECMSASEVDAEVDHRRVQPGFCNGVISAGLPIGHDECIQTMEAQKFWPTMTGALTNSYNRRFPYPGDWLTSNAPATGESRTGDRETTDREGFAR